MNRKQDSPLAAVFQARGPDIQYQAVFASSAGLCRPLDRSRVVIVAAGQGLRRDVAPFEGVVRALPWRWLARRNEAVLTGSIRPTRHAAKHVNAVFGAAAESAIGRLRNWRGRRRARGSHHERGGPRSADACREQRILFQEMRGELAYVSPPDCSFLGSEAQFSFRYVTASATDSAESGRRAGGAMWPSRGHRVPRRNIRG